MSSCSMVGGRRSVKEKIWMLLAFARLSLGVDNLLDVRYRDILSRFRYFIDEPGRNVTFRVTVPFGSVDT